MNEHLDTIYTGEIHSGPAPGPEKYPERKNDGGPAFPDKVVQDTVLGPSVFARMAGGMTLRDWFAGQALAGLCANHGGSNVPVTISWAYAHADAMLAEREKP